MNSIVHSAIHEVSQNKAREKHECILSQKQIKQTKDCRGNNNAWNWRHEQPLPVPWIMMMVAMERIRNFFSYRVITYPMEKIPVRYVFKKRPEKHAT